MKQLFTLCLCSFFANVLLAQTPAKKKVVKPISTKTAKPVAKASKAPYRITLNVPQFKSGKVYLTYFWGKNYNIEDSAFVNNKGIAVFNGANNNAAKQVGPTYRIPGGIYAVFLPGNTRIVDFLLDKETNFSITITDTNAVQKAVFTGLKENVLYEQYKKNSSEWGRMMEQETNLYKSSLTREDSAKHEKNYTEYSKQLNAYREDIMKNKPTSMLAVLLNAMHEPSVLINNPITHEDSLQNYYHYKSKYWEGTTFMDERVIRTPFFLPKFERYYRDIIVQHPDTIKKSTDYQLLLARNSTEMYKFMLNWLTDEYINPKYMGLDAVFVHLFEKYHSKGVSSWLNEKQMEQITRRAYMLMSNLVGEKAANLEMIDTTGKATPLYGVKAPYTLVMFWDPNCGHCKEEIPHIDSLYQASWKAKGIKIYAVLAADTKEDVHQAWLNFIHEKKIEEWTHVYMTKEMDDAEKAAQKANYHQLYDITQTPTLYLLDAEKRIIGKKLTWQQTMDLLEVKMSQNKTNQN
ncbi:MAG: redoxin domain-containing protein [Ferruginibacter sp.]